HPSRVKGAPDPPLPLPEGHSDRLGAERAAVRHRRLQARASRAVCELLEARVRDGRPHAEGDARAAVTWPIDELKTAAIVFVVTIFQVSVLSSITLFGGSANLVLITLVAVALLRGSIFGAAAGFFAGIPLALAPPRPPFRPAP